ncbi:lysozyme inhibitor LprI family protein [Maricaulaceae bacterium EIL42A08]|nr:lysozyme inhibitor LprI family protein [Maricaulaceae bacterium EIL42A08]
MKLTSVARMFVIAAAFIATPAVAENADWSQGSDWQFNSGPLTRYYTQTPLEECRRGSQGDLELRACLSRLLLEAESRYDISFRTLVTMVEEREDQFQQAEEAEALRFARETWRSYLDFQCDFEGAMLGDSYSARSLQATSCRVSLLRAQTERLTELAGQIDPAGIDPGWSPDPDQCVGPFCSVETETYRDWTARCRRGGLCTAFTTVGDGEASDRLETALRASGDGWNIIFSSNRHPVDAARAIAVRVDGRNPVVFRPYSGYSASENGAFVLSDQESTSRLIGAMRRGSRLTVQYVDVSGNDRLATFSLMGVSRSLEWVEARQVRVRY